MKIQKNPLFLLMSYKIVYFPILHIIYKLPLSYSTKMGFKQRLFFDKFTNFARKNFLMETRNDKGKYNIYDINLFKLCLFLDNGQFPVANLEWNLAHEYLDVVGPSISPLFSKFIIGEGPYEKGPCVLQKGATVIDAGSNIGMFSFLASQKVGNAGQVHAIEPIPFFQKCLKKGIEENGINNVIVHNIALGNQNKDCLFQLDAGNPMGSKIGSGGTNSISVTLSTLDDFVFEKAKIDRVDFIKMDIEGAERAALEGASQTISKFKPKLSICTYHLPDDPYVLPQIIRKIEPQYTILLGRKKLHAFV